MAVGRGCKAVELCDRCHLAYSVPVQVRVWRAAVENQVVCRLDGTLAFRLPERCYFVLLMRATREWASSVSLMVVVFFFFYEIFGIRCALGGGR